MQNIDITNKDHKSAYNAISPITSTTAIILTNSNNELSINEIYASVVTIDSCSICTRTDNKNVISVVVIKLLQARIRKSTRRFLPLLVSMMLFCAVNLTKYYNLQLLDVQFVDYSKHQEELKEIVNMS
jgi:hypothetical protein